MTAPTLVAVVCPPWCDGICRACTCGDPVCGLLHTQHDTRVEGINLLDDGPRAGQPNAALVALEREDTFDGPGAVYLNLDFYRPSLHLTPAQARELAAALNRLADQGEDR